MSETKHGVVLLLGLPSLLLRGEGVDSSEEIGLDSADTALGFVLLLEL